MKGVLYGLGRHIPDFPLQVPSPNNADITALHVAGAAEPIIGPEDTRTKVAAQLVEIGKLMYK
jgi:hypothetical protein